jgi:hypothetical protein
VLAFRAVAVGASVGTMFLVGAAARRIAPERAAFAAVLVGWNPVVLFHGAGGGHNDTLVGLALAGAALLVLAGRSLWATAVLTVGTLVKVSAGVPLLVLVLASVITAEPGERLRRLGQHVLVALAAGLPFVVPFMQTEDPTLGALELTSRQGWLAPSRLLLVVLKGMASFLGGDVAGDVASALVRVAFPVLFLVVLVGLIRHLGREPGRVDPPLVLAAIGWATLLAVMVSPLLYPWYMAWLVPLVWILPRRARVGAVVISVALTITELVAEPSRAPAVWEVMVFSLHYIATPIVLGVFIWLLVDLRRRLAVGARPGWEDPLLLEDVAPTEGAGNRRVLAAATAGPDRRQVAERGERGGHGDTPRRR